MADTINNIAKAKSSKQTVEMIVTKTVKEFKECLEEDYKKYPEIVTQGEKDIDHDEQTVLSALKRFGFDLKKLLDSYDVNQFKNLIKKLGCYCYKQIEAHIAKKAPFMTNKKKNCVCDVDKKECTRKPCKDMNTMLNNITKNKSSLVKNVPEVFSILNNDSSTIRYFLQPIVSAYGIFTTNSLHRIIYITKGYSRSEKYALRKISITKLENPVRLRNCATAKRVC